MLPGLPGSGPQGLIDAPKCGNTIGTGITVSWNKAQPRLFHQKIPCWSNSDSGPTIGPKQFQMNLQIQTTQIQTKSSGVIILNLIGHYYCAKYNSSFIPRMSVSLSLKACSDTNTMTQHDVILCEFLVQRTNRNLLPTILRFQISVILLQVLTTPAVWARLTNTW